MLLFRMSYFWRIHFLIFLINNNFEFIFYFHLDSISGSLLKKFENFWFLKTTEVRWLLTKIMQ